MLSGLRILGLLGMLALSACAAGPDFVPPPPPEAAAYSPSGFPQTTASADVAGGVAQKFLPNGKVPAEWWNLFGSSPLNALVASGLQSNPTAKEAEASLKAAKERVFAMRGSLFPSVDLSGNITSQRSVMAGGGGFVDPTFTLYNASVNVSYAIDFFGLTRRALEKSQAAEDYQRFYLDAARSSVAANIVTAAISRAAFLAQIDAARENVAASEKQLEMLRAQFEAGAVSKSATLSQEAALAATRATLPDLERKASEAGNLLAALTGRMPHEGLGEDIGLDSLKLPEELPVTLPSDLVKNRPDIRAAESQLRAASAAIGIATANMLPRFPLSASYGSQSYNIDAFASPASAIWSVGEGVLQPLFRGGELLHKRRAAEADYEAALAAYRGAVLTALREVADVLRALQFDAEALKTQTEAEKAAAASMEMARMQFDAGAISYLALLDAEQALQKAKIAAVQARARRYADTAALFHALGNSYSQ